MSKPKSSEHRRKLSEASKQNGSLPPSRCGIKLPPEQRLKISNALKGKSKSVEHRRKMSEARKGEKSPHWRGGLTSINLTIRKSLEYKLWREAVFQRDNFTCQFCGQRGGKLHADHIKPFCDYPEERFALNNGRTLCISCHKTTNTYGCASLTFRLQER